MNFTDYNNSIYEDIQSDEQLRNFFVKLTTYTTKLLLLKKENQNQENNIEEPNLNRISEIISRLEQNDIKVVCTDNPHPFGFSSPLEYITFNSIYIKTKDLEFIKEKVKFGFDACDEKSPAEKGYCIWQEENKGLSKKIEKIKKSEMKNRKSKTFLTTFECFEKINGDVLKQRADFVKNINTEQMTLLADLYDSMNSYKLSYYAYKKKERERDNFLNEITESVYEEALDSIINSSLNEINIATLIRRLFRILIINKLENQIKSASREKTMDFDTNVVDWFIRYKKDNLSELYNVIFNDFDLVVDDKIGKLKEKSLGGIS